MYYISNSIYEEYYCEENFFMPSAVEIILMPTLMILLGYFLKKTNVLKQSDLITLTDIVIYVCLPCMIFINLYNADISHDMLMLPVLGLILNIVLALIAFCYCKARGYSTKTTWTIILAASMMNTGFIGYPVSLGVFGNSGLLNAIFFDLSTTILFISYGIILVKRFGGNRKEVFMNAVKFIPVWAVIFALIFNIFNIPLIPIAENILTYFGDATIALIMLALGLSLDFRGIGKNISDSLVVSVLKLVVSPVIIYLLLGLANIGGMAFNVAILEAGMSTAMNALVLSIMYDLDSDLMASLIFTNIILSLFTLTGIISILT